MPTGSFLRRAARLAVTVMLVGCGRAADGAQKQADEAGATGGAAAAVARSDSPTSSQRASLRGPGYDLGSPDAPVLVLEFSDFGCGFCRRFAQQTFPQIESEFISQGTVRWKYVPFVMGIFPHGGEAALAAECAGSQDASAFWRMHDKLYTNQPEWRNTNDPEGLFLSYAAEVGLDSPAFTTCYGSDEVKNRIADHNELAARLGVHGTPTFFIEGVAIQGAQPIQVFRILLRGALVGGR